MDTSEPKVLKSLTISNSYPEFDLWAYKFTTLFTLRSVSGTYFKYTEIPKYVTPVAYIQNIQETEGDVSNDVRTKEMIGLVPCKDADKTINSIFFGNPRYKEFSEIFAYCLDTKSPDTFRIKD